MCTDGAVQLSGGLTESEGTIEICFDNFWDLVYKCTNSNPKNDDHWLPDLFIAIMQLFLLQNAYMYESYFPNIEAQASVSFSRIISRLLNGSGFKLGPACNFDLFKPILRRYKIIMQL